MDDLSRGCSTSEAMSRFTQLFSTWIDLFLESNRVFKQDEGFWYSERGLVTMLGSAAGRLEIPALAEPQTTKYDSDNDQEWKGRPDLLLQFGTERVGLEAKLIWLENSTSVSAMDQMVQLACRDATFLRESQVDTRIGLVFGLWWSAPNDSRAKYMQNFLNSLHSRKYDLLAWAREPIQAEHHHCPGSILVGKVIEQGN